MTNKLYLCIKTPLSDLLFVSLSGGKDKQLEVLGIFITIQWEVMHITLVNMFECEPVGIFHIALENEFAE